MLNAALALAAVMTFPPNTSLPQRVASNPSCALAGIDPSFVHYVPQAPSVMGANPPLRLVSLGRDAGLASHLGVGCVRPILVRDLR